MSTPARWALAALLIATGLTAQRSGNWVVRTGFAVLIDAHGTGIEARGLGSPNLVAKVLRGSGNTTISYSTIARTLVISNRGTAKTVGLAGNVIDFTADRNQNAWVIRTGHNGVEAFDYSAQLKRTVNLIGQPRAMCLTSQNELWVCENGNPGAILHWFDAASPMPVPNLVTLPPSFGTATQMLATLPVNGNPTLWLINGSHDELLHIDNRGQILATHVIGTTQGENNRAITLDNQGDLWVTTNHGLYEWNAATQTARLDRLIQAGETFHFDARGLLWRNRGTTLTRFQLSDPRPDVFSANATTHGGDPAGLYRAMIIAPTDDEDGDGEGNLVEIRTGTDPYDSSSNSTIDLRLQRVLTTLGTNLELDLFGATHPAVLVVASGGAIFEITIPGIVGTLRFPLIKLEPVVLSIPFGGHIRIPIPANVVLSGQRFTLQAFSGNGLKLSNHVTVAFKTERRITLRESFSTTNQLDIDRSGGAWGLGIAKGGKLGGIGILGSFDPTLGNEIAPNVFVWNTDQMTIPSTHTLFGNTVVVTNGRFGFTDFNVPAGVTVRFEGTQAAIISVRGRVEINGHVTVNGHDVPSDYNGAATGIIAYIPNAGQAAVPGGAGGGAGGPGAKGHAGAGVNPLHNGQHGDDLVVPGTSGYSGVVTATGGRGSRMFPAAGTNASLNFNYGGVIGYASQTVSGGGGGGYLQPGGTGTATRTFSGLAADLAPNTAGGLGVPFMPLWPGATALDHFLIGGSGGGGTGSHALGIQQTLIQTSNYPWHGGGAGAGGGGALAFLSGGDFAVGLVGSLEAHGGNGDATLGGGLLMSFGQFPPAPGGAGSGGTIVVQTDGQVTQQGSIDVTGGSAGMHRSRGPLLTGNASMDGGAGAPGFVRVEQTGMTAMQLGTVKGIRVSNQNWSAQVNARADWSGMQSLWYRTRMEYAPTYEHYELVVQVNGNRVTYTDDPARYNPANQPGHPVSLFVQGAQFDAMGQRVSEPTAWRDRVNGSTNSLNADNANGYRFMLLFDPTVVQNVAVEEFRLTHRF